MFQSLLCSRERVPGLHPASSSKNKNKLKKKKGKKEKFPPPISLDLLGRPSTFQRHSWLRYRPSPAASPEPAGSSGGFQGTTGTQPSFLPSHIKDGDPPSRGLKSHTGQTSTFTRLAQTIKTSSILARKPHQAHGEESTGLRWSHLEGSASPSAPSTPGGEVWEHTAPQNFVRSRHIPALPPCTAGSRAEQMF